MKNTQDIEKRLNALEKKSRRYQAISTMLALLFVAGFLMGAKWFKKDEKQTGPVDIKANKIEIVDEKGRTRIMLFVGDLEIAGEEALKNAPAVVLYGENGKARSIMLTEKKEAGLILLDEEEVPRIGFLTRGGSSIIALIDGKGKPRLELKSDEGNTLIRLMDNKHIPRFVIGSAEDLTELRITDGGGQNRVKLIVEGDKTTFGILDGKGEVLFQVPKK